MQVGGRITTPVGTATLRITLRVAQVNGWVAFDDVSLRQVDTLANLVTNPGFESGMAGWTATRVSGHAGTALVLGQTGTSTPYAGGWAYSISNLADGSLTSSSSAVMPNTMYQLYAWMRGYVDPEESGSAAKLVAHFYDANGDYMVSSLVQEGEGGPVGNSASEWAWLGGTVSTPANAATMAVALLVSEADGWVAIDNVVLAEEIAPSKMHDGARARAGWFAFQLDDDEASDRVPPAGEDEGVVVEGPVGEQFHQGAQRPAERAKGRQ